MLQRACVAVHSHIPSAGTVDAGGSARRRDQTCMVSLTAFSTVGLESHIFKGNYVNFHDSLKLLLWFCFFLIMKEVNVPKP